MFSNCFGMSNTIFPREIIALECVILCLQDELLFWGVIYYVCKGNYCFGVINYVCM